MIPNRLINPVETVKPLLKAQLFIVSGVFLCKFIVEVFPRPLNFLPLLPHNFCNEESFLFSRMVTMPERSAWVLFKTQPITTYVRNTNMPM